MIDPLRPNARNVTPPDDLRARVIVNIRQRLEVIQRTAVCAFQVVHGSRSIPGRSGIMKNDDMIDYHRIGIIALHALQPAWQLMINLQKHVFHS
jgi:hypothetical protein